MFAAKTLGIDCKNVVYTEAEQNQTKLIKHLHMNILGLLAMAHYFPKTTRLYNNLDTFLRRF